MSRDAARVGGRRPDPIAVGGSIMADRKTRRLAPACDHLESREVAAVVGLAPAAVALYSSPLISAASTAAPRPTRSGNWPTPGARPSSWAP